MSKNVFVRMPKRGDCAIKKISNKKRMYISLETLDVATLDTTAYEVVGTVAGRIGDKNLIAYKNNTSHKYINRAWWYLSGYTLDGTDRTGILSIAAASASWGNVSKTIAYNATTVEDFVSQLNTFFTTDTDCLAQDWYANLEPDGRVRIHCNNISWQQCANNKAGTGFSLTGSCPEIIAKADMRRKHGGNGGEGAISSWKRALAYYRNDNGKDSYAGGRTSTQTSIKQTYPINLPTWLGTSTKNPGDFCAALREVYGEGEEGWIKFMRSCLPVVPCDYGNMGMHNGSERTRQLASFTFTSAKVTTPSPMANAAAYCDGISTDCIDKGEFWLGTTEEIAILMRDIEYGTNDSRLSDPVNKCLSIIGGSAISNGSSVWSCCRCGSYGAWYSHGCHGFFYGHGMYGSCVSVPLSLWNDDTSLGED